MLVITPADLYPCRATPTGNEKDHKLQEFGAHLALQGLLRDCIPNDRLRSALLLLLSAIQVNRDDLSMRLATTNHFHCKLCAIFVVQPAFCQDQVYLQAALETRPACYS